jgi:uracil-DNA glycosylase family 4
MKTGKNKEFDILVSSIESCDSCKRMCGQKKVLSDKNGKLDSKVIFIAEAPGRLGAGNTGIPLYGDKTGENFEILLNHIGWKREDVFITNTVLCTPLKNGKNDSPNKEEIRNCTKYLRKTIEIIDPEIIITIGSEALKALKLIEPHNFELEKCVAQQLSWNNKYLFPLYHMSPILFNCPRNGKEQKDDFATLSKIIDPVYGIKSK